MTQARVTLWGIEVFLAAAEEGAVSAAARRLGVSPSAVSQQLAALELALGATLLDRGARPMLVTPAGAMFRRHAHTILNAEAEARADLALSDLAVLTTLRLGMIEDFDADVTPALLTAMAADLRGCRFLLETGASHRLLDGLEARALDIVVAADGLDGPTADADWREVHPLLAEPFVVAAPCGLELGQDPRHALSALPLIQYSARHLMGRQIAAHLGRQNLHLSHRFELDSYSAILAMVAEGVGWTILTPLALRSAPRFEAAITVMPLPFGPLERTISLSARAGVLRDMPAQMAVRLRGLLTAQVVDPCMARMPWLHGTLRVL
jgi:DNA-binding transcriptional LysR family regulator